MMVVIAISVHQSFVKHEHLPFGSPQIFRLEHGFTRQCRSFMQSVVEEDYTG